MKPFDKEIVSEVQEVGRSNIRANSVAWKVRASQAGRGVSRAG
jgi:hypothetical protein